MKYLIFLVKINAKKPFRLKRAISLGFFGTFNAGTKIGPFLILAKLQDPKDPVCFFSAMWFFFWYYSEALLQFLEEAKRFARFQGNLRLFRHYATCPRHLSEKKYIQKIVLNFSLNLWCFEVLCWGKPYPTLQGDIFRYCSWEFFQYQQKNPRLYWHGATFFWEKISFVLRVFLYFPNILTQKTCFAVLEGILGYFSTTRLQESLSEMTDYFSSIFGIFWWVQFRKSCFRVTRVPLSISFNPTPEYFKRLALFEPWEEFRFGPLPACLIIWAVWRAFEPRFRYTFSAKPVWRKISWCLASALFLIFSQMKIGCVF